MHDTALPEAVSVAELRELAANMPAVARALVSLHRRARAAGERAEAMAARLGDDWQPLAMPPMPFEEVRDFFYARHNHIAELDGPAERLHADLGLLPGAADAGLADYLAARHAVAMDDTIDDPAGSPRHYDPARRLLRLSSGLRPGQRAFQMATQLAFLEAGPLLHQRAEDAGLSGDEARSLARIGLANYFAGALPMPYGTFLQAAEARRYDIERLAREFGVGFETICHRLSTLQRPEARGVPFFFVRVDRAGNISKRQSATDFHFSRVGGSCPLRNVYEAFVQPGRILTQRAQMPDGRHYLWVARTVSHGSGGYGAPGKTFAVGLGCDLRHATRLRRTRSAIPPASGQAERFCSALGIDIRHGGARAYYSPSTDHVQMPEFVSFREAVAYYAVLLHECGHASGARHRLDRDLSGRFGSAAYAMEECTVELLSAMICADLNLSVEPRLDHASHAASCLEVLRSDKRAIFTAAAKAQQIADWMHAQQGDARRHEVRGAE